jgi:hypothetical protein
MANVARRGGMACSAARFTHVVDNSIVLDRLRHWCDDGEAVRLHSPDTVFYIQSAIESAQLLLAALLSPADDVFRLYTIHDLDWPVSLLDLALGFIASGRRVTPIYLAGHEPGYEESPYPGLYDPTLSGDVSPLLNAIEAHHVEEGVCAGVDVAAMAACDVPDVINRLPELQRWCQVGADRQARRVLDEIGWDLLVSTVRATSPVVLDRIARLTEDYRPTMSREHRRIDDVVRRYALKTQVPTIRAARSPSSRPRSQGWSCCA